MPYTKVIVQEPTAIHPCEDLQLPSGPVPSYLLEMSPVADPENITEEPTSARPCEDLHLPSGPVTLNVEICKVSDATRPISSRRWASYILLLSVHISLLISGNQVNTSRR